jgi:hypothetical protein
MVHSILVIADRLQAQANFTRRRSATETGPAVWHRLDPAWRIALRWLANCVSIHLLYTNSLPRDECLKQALSRAFVEDGPVLWLSPIATIISQAMTRSKRAGPLRKLEKTRAKTTAKIGRYFTTRLDLGVIS